LLGLDLDQMLFCLGIALPLANGSLRGCGYMSHVHEAGVPSRTGVFAALLAADGFTACPDYLDGAYSWGEQYAGGGPRPYNAEALTADLGSTFFLEACDVAPKQYGACGLTHQTMEGTIDLMREHRISSDDIASIELRVPPWADRVASFKDPENGEQAKFSIRQGVAGILVDGIPELPYVRPFSDATCNDPQYVEARKRVILTIEEGQPNQRAFVKQSVVITLHDGRILSRDVEGKLVRGHVANPYTTDERIDMVRHTVARMGHDRTERFIELVMGLEQHDVGDVSEVLSVS
jgi:2-methylcitrate dehydratase PrpD